jgi:hypothetical protein
MKYVCEKCGEEHEDWPALTFNSPHFYRILSEQDKKGIATIDADFCTITYPDRTDRFIRVTLTQKVNDHCEDLEYGLWVSLSEKSFNDYSDNYNNELHKAGYFGYLSNWIPSYADTLSIHTNVNTRTGNQRPYIEPDEDFDHPFVKDYYAGISKEEAERRIKAMVEDL